MSQILIINTDFAFLCFPSLKILKKSLKTLFIRFNRTSFLFYQNVFKPNNHFPAFHLFYPFPFNHEQMGKYTIVRLDHTTVCRSKHRVRECGKEEGERLFQELLALLRNNFPPTEIENESQYRRYFHARTGSEWFVWVAVQKKVIGAFLYSYDPRVRVIATNILVVDKEYRGKHVATALFNKCIESLKSYKALYMIGEVEPPIKGLKGSEGKMRNVIRPSFQDYITKLRPIRLKNGRPLLYFLPVMATDKERRAAKKEGKPLVPTPMLFCVRPFAYDEKEGISPREVAELLIWFYKDYLERECSNVKPAEVNVLLARTLSQLIPGKRNKVMGLLKKGRRGLSKVLAQIPEAPKLSFMKIGEV